MDEYVERPIQGTGGSPITRILGPQKIRVIGELFKYFVAVKRAP